MALQFENDGNVCGDPRPRISFGSWSEYSIDMSQFQGVDGSDNDFRLLHSNYAIAYFIFSTILMDCFAVTKKTRIAKSFQ